MGSGSSSQEDKKKKHHKLLKEVVSGPDSHFSFLWVCEHSLFYRLSANLAREVTTYIRDPPLLLASLHDRVYLYSITTKKYLLYFILDLNVYAHIQNCAFMGEGRVFMSLRSTRNIGGGPVEFAIYLQGENHLLKAIGNKHGCEIIYDKLRNCIYIFDARNSALGSIISTTKVSHVFTPSNIKFRQIESMRRTRSHFGCCWHLEMIYLCGGGSDTVETFDPHREIFADFSVGKHWVQVTLAASFKGELTFLAPSTSWTLRGGEWVPMQRNMCQIFSRSGTATVWNGVMYYHHSNYQGNGFIGLNLANGKELFFPAKKLTFVQK